jgi:hypothetical protein
MNFYPPPRKPSLCRRIGLLWLALPEPVRMGVLLVALVLVAFLSGCATAPKPEGVQITITEDEAKACLAAGGCGLLSRAEVAAIQFQAYMLGQKEAFGSDAFDSQGCKRSSI